MKPLQELVAKYSRQAPRYTSYPSALHFREAGEDFSRMEQHLQVAGRSGGNLSLYIHLPFCASLCWYCGCTKVISRKEGEARSYLKRLFLEMQRMAKIIHPEHTVRQIHFGGGTPTFLSPDELLETGRMIHSLFRIDPKAECAVEIDPRKMTRQHAESLAEMGCNRASLGIQDVREEVQRAVHRWQPMPVNEQAIRWLRNQDISHINIDLIYGLPLQTCRSFSNTLDAVLELDPDRFAIFNYAHVPWIIPSQKLLKSSDIPGSWEKFQMLEMMIDKLTGTGYRYIGMDHFAKNLDELAVAQRNGTLQRNFQGYSTHARTDIYGFGMSAISQIGNGYLQSVKDLNLYYHRVDRNLPVLAKEYYLSEDDLIRRHVIMRLMCDLALDYPSINERWNIDAAEYFRHSRPLLEELEDDGLIEASENGIRVTRTGRMFLRNIATAFDAYHAGSKNVRRYSKTV